MAWFGGSKGKPDTQYDCLVWAVSDPLANDVAVQIHPLKLIERDPNAEQIFREIRKVIERDGDGLHVVLAIDAPLSGVRAIPEGRQKVRRFCEDRLAVGRKVIDRAMGGARKWHPTIQPGMPLAPRVKLLVAELKKKLKMRLWSTGFADHPRLIIECFPAEAIWAAKRLGGYAAHTSGTAIKSYKKQQGKVLSASKVETFVGDVLLSSFEPLTDLPNHWPKMVKKLISRMLQRKDWGKDGNYKGGKFLDDVVDSAICLATALSYANGFAHVWYDPENPDDGHIIGPGHCRNSSPEGPDLYENLHHP
jgi:hypothetical protein